MANQTYTDAWMNRRAELLAADSGAAECWYDKGNASHSHKFRITTKTGQQHTLVGRTKRELVEVSVGFVIACRIHNEDK